MSVDLTYTMKTDPHLSGKQLSEQNSSSARKSILRFNTDLGYLGLNTDLNKGGREVFNTVSYGEVSPLLQLARKWQPFNQ